MLPSMQQARRDRPTAARMLSYAPNPVCPGPWEHHRPAVSSPLSSSPVRASSPLSPVDDNARHRRQIQSSPIKPIKFKYASRPSRPNPVVRKREDAQEHRRRNFLQNVRQKADDKAWQRRDIEGQFLKTNWLASVGRLSYDAPSFSDADIEDAVAFQQETAQSQQDDETMDDEPREEEELEVMLVSYEEQHRRPPPRFPPVPEEDDEYDDIFAELISQERAVQSQPPDPSSQMDISD